MAQKLLIGLLGILLILAIAVALSPNQLDFMRDQNGNVHAHTSWTKEQIKGLPEHHH